MQPWRCFFFSLFATTLASHTWAADYAVGHTWQRETTFNPGHRNDRTSGNPSADGRGQPVHHYTVVQTPRDASDPSLNGPAAGRWYRLPRTAMQWDRGQQQWRLERATIDAVSLIHAGRSRGNDYDRVPVYAWQNPAGDGKRVSIECDYWLTWSHPVEADLVVAHFDASNGHWRELSPTGRYGKPSDRQTLTLFADPVEQDVDAGDLIVISVRAAEPIDDDRAMLMLRDNVQFTLIDRPPVQAPAAKPPTSTTGNPGTPTPLTPPQAIESRQMDAGVMTAVFVAAGVVINVAWIVLFLRWRRGRKAHGLE